MTGVSGLHKIDNAKERVAEYTKQLRDRNEYRISVSIRYQHSAPLYITALD